MANASSMGMTTALGTTSLTTAPTTTSTALAVVTTTQAAAAAAASSSPASSQRGDLDAVRTVQKRYDGLLSVRNKALRGKGAWYWAFLDPFLVPNPDNPAVPKAVKLRCSLCDAVFSASNPSRTASEHLKRGTCPNFASPSTATTATTSPLPPQLHTPSSQPKPLSSMAPSTYHHHPQQQHHHIRKRPSSSSHPHPSASSYNTTPLAVVDPIHFAVYPTSTTPTHQSPHPPMAAPLQPMLPLPPPSSPSPPPRQHLMLSGGKEDLGKLAMLEDSVKRFKSPKASPARALTKDQADSALSLFADWVYECCGAVSPSSLDHPKFRAFLHQVGLPEFTRRDLVGLRLDARHAQVSSDSRARIQGALFFQIASDGRWPPRATTSAAALATTTNDSDALLSLVVNLPHGTSVLWKAVVTRGRKVPHKHAADILWAAVEGVSEDAPKRCAGIVSNRFSFALRDLEARNPGMINLTCLLKTFRSLLKDLATAHNFVANVIDNCSRVAHLLNTSVLLDTLPPPYAGYGFPRQVSCFPPRSGRVFDADLLFAMLDDVLLSSKLLTDIIDDVSVDDQDAAEVVRDSIFWDDLTAVHSLVKAVLEFVKEVDDDRPFVGQCLPLWEDLRGRVADWCSTHNINHDITMKLVDKRFRKSYHPAWAAAFVLDPLYLLKDPAGKYLPPFRCLTQEQEKDVYDLISKLVPPDETHVAISELMRWRSDGLDRTYALAVQMKLPDPVTGKMRISNPQSSRLVWESHLRDFTKLGNVAVRLIFLHATSTGFRCNPSFLRWVATPRSAVAAAGASDVAHKMLFIAGNSKLERRDYSCEEDKDADLFAKGDGDMLREAQLSAASV